MKKYIFTILSLALVVFVSCTDQKDIEIIKHQDVQIIVDVSDMYKQVGTTSIQNLLGNNKTFAVGVTVLFYDKDGMCCQEASTTTRVLESVPLSLTGIEEGTYTVICIENILDTQSGTSQQMWSIDKKDILDSVRVVSKKHQIYWYNCLGISTNTVEISGNKKEMNITPKLQGCLVEFECENFDKSNYSYLGFFFKNVADGIYLSPSRPASEKYYYEDGYLASKTWSARGYFYYDEQLPETEAATLYIPETGSVNYCFGPSIPDEDGNISFTAYPSRNAYFTFEQGGYYEAFAYYKGAPTELETFVGTMSDFKTWYKNLDKDMNPVFAEPCTKWGATVSYVKNAMKDYTLYQDVTDTGKGTYSLIYLGNYKEDAIYYYFNTKTSDLSIVDIVVVEKNASLEDILSMYNKLGYEYSDELVKDLNLHVYSNDNNLIMIMPGLKFSDGTGFTLIEYAPNVPASSSTAGKDYNANNAVLNIPGDLTRFERLR